MRLLKIGRDVSCDIVLHSDKTSSLHAEMIVLNNGDILLEDKNSMNGTFLMNKPIKPGTSVQVKRGDAIRFADVELVWSQIPMPEDNSRYKALFGIGTNFRNEIQVAGNTVSRFHATLKIGRDGKTYIQDHSKNGTTINGVRVVPGQNVRIRRTDAIVCGGVPVDLKRYVRASFSGIGKTIGGTLALAAVLVGVMLLLKGCKEEPSLQVLQNATACVYGQYYIEVTLEDDPFIGRIDDWPEKWTFGVSQKSGEPKLTLGVAGNTISPIQYTGTAFFISPYGELGTNRHIAVPWEYISREENDLIKQQMENAIGNLSGSLLLLLNEAIEKDVLSTRDAQSYYNRLQKSPIRISGRFNYLGIAQAGTQVNSVSDLLPCQVIAQSDDKERDVALLRLNSKQTPAQIVKEGYFNIANARCDQNTLVPQEETMTTMGYPAGFQIGFSTAHATELTPTVHKAYISKKPDENSFQFQGESLGGQSGSPIVDEKRHLVGVLYGGYTQTEFSYGCNIKHLVELYNKNKVTL